MKKTVLFAFLSLAMMGCKEKKNEEPAQKTPQEAQTVQQKDHECLTLEQYDALPSLEEKAEWLHKYGKAVCDDILFEASKKTHTIGTGEFKPAPGGSLKKSWNEIDSKTSQFSVYERYLSFDIDTVKKVIKDIKVVSTFDKKVPCYSLALFRAIAKENNYKNISFEFMYADVKAGETIIIKVTDMNGKVLYFDYSDEPKKNDGPIATRRIKSPL